MAETNHHPHAQAEHAHPAQQRHCDVAVIGGSAAGLAAALQLARQRRSVIEVDDVTPRNAPAAHMHGYLGREGTPPAELVAIGRSEVRSYGGEVLTGRVLAVHRAEDGQFQLELSGGHRLIARRVLAATGIADELPEIAGLAEHWGRDAINCPFCHGYEVRDRRLVQVVTHPMGLHQTPVWRHLSAQLTLVLDDAAGIDGAAVQQLVATGVAVRRGTARRLLASAGGRLEALELSSGEVVPADAVVIGPRFRARADTLADAGVLPTPHPSGMGDVVAVDPITGQTVVPGLYAAGNLTDPSLQVLPAAAHGSRVAAMIAFDLAEEDARTGVRRSGAQADWEQRYSGKEPTWSQNPNGTLVDQAADLAPGRALDVGAGEGADALWLAERGWQVTACDISANALARISGEADRRGLDVRCLRVDANDRAAFDGQTYDLVSLQYGSFHRTPDERGLANLLGAVAPGGTLLVVGHDLTPMREPVDVNVQTRMYDSEAYVGVEEIAGKLAGSPQWQIQLHETRPRPPGAASTHHVDDVVLRAIKLS